MNSRFIFYTLGKLLQVLSLILIVPASIAIWESMWDFYDPKSIGFTLSILLSASFGSFLVLAFRNDRGQIGIREGFAIVYFGWLLLTFVGSIPLFTYLLSQLDTIRPESIFLVFTDSFFEVMSGFTTTGASVISDVEKLPLGILFWRSLTHWLGGMGIVTLALALFPAFGVAAYQLFRGEVPGPSKERLKPRLAQTAIILWGVYAFLTLVESVLLMAGGMSIFDSVIHAFGTMATGGFSTKNASLAYYDSNYFDWVITLFMFLAGTNFIIHYRLLFSGDTSILKTNREFHFYVGTILIAIVLIAIVLNHKGVISAEESLMHFRVSQPTMEQLSKKLTIENERIGSLYEIIRCTSFQVLSIITTTGYSNADWDLWPDFVRFTLLILMFFGGSAGSTAGGIKMIRILVLLKYALRQIRIMVQPRLIAPVKIAGQSLEERQVENIVGFFLLFLLLFIMFSAIMSLMIPDFTTALTSVAATLCNIGPGISGVGAFENYSWIHPIGKWVLIICMLLGRLEIYTVLIAFAPISWRK